MLEDSRTSNTAATRGWWAHVKSAGRETSPHLLAISSTERRALESFPGPVSFSTETTTSSEAVRLSRTTAATTTDEVQERSSQRRTSLRMFSRMSKYFFMR